MKTIANIAIIGLASALRIAEEGRQAEDIDTEIDYCAKVAEIPEDATWEEISGMITKETGDVWEEADYANFLEDCFGSADGEQSEETSGDEATEETSGDEAADESSQGPDSTDEEEPMDGSETSSVFDDGEGSLTSDEEDAGSVATDQTDYDTPTSFDGEDSAEGSDSADGSETEGEDGDDQLFDDSDDSNDSEEEFAYWCERIAELPEGASWEDVEAGLIEEFGEDAPAQEEFIAVSWACGAVEHGTDFINDFEDICDAIAEELPEGATYADVADFLTEELGDDAPTEEEWDAINWACAAAAEYGEDYYGEDYYGEDEDDSTPAPTTEAQIKDDTVSEEEHHHCEDLAHLAEIGVLEGSWDEILAYIVEHHGAEGAPTQAEFEAEEAFCAAQGPPKPHGDGAAQTKVDESDDEDDSEGPTEEEIAELFAACEVLEHIPAGAHWTDVEKILVDELDADDVPTKDEWFDFQDFCAGGLDM